MSYSFYDPQLIASPGTFGETLRLGAGAQLFSVPNGDGIGSSSSSLHFEYDAINILSLPIASIDISSTDGTSPLAVVAFNSDPRLHFYVAGSPSTSITDDEVTAILNSPSVVSQLMSASGLLSDLPLFHFTMDLTNTTLSPDAGFGAVVLAQVQGVGIPEPSSLVLLWAAWPLTLLLSRRRSR